MYLEHFGLNEKPFSHSPDPRYLWFGDRQLGLYAALESAILRGSGLVLLTGAVGTGKTTFIKSVEADLRNQAVFANMRDPALQELEFYNLIAHSLGTNQNFSVPDEFYNFLRSLSRDALKTRLRVVIAVDEAQRIEARLLEKIVSLNKRETEMSEAVTWVFVGQDELIDRLPGDRARLLNDGSLENFRMEPLEREETGEYIHFRLKRAGATKAIFSQKAIDRVYHYSAGHPRLINSICDVALLCGYGEGSKRIRAKMIGECVDKVCLQKPPLCRSAPKSTHIKATACVLASMCCLSVYGLWTYQSQPSDIDTPSSLTDGVFLQGVLPERLGQAPLKEVNLQSTDPARPYRVDPAQAFPGKRGNRNASEDTGSAAEPKSDSTPDAGVPGAVSEPVVSYGAASDRPAVDGTRPKQARVPQKAPAPADGNFSVNDPAQQSDNTSRGEEPDPADIIDWLLKK